MQQHFNFKTGKSVNILEQITHFYINPYMPDNFKHLRIKERIEMDNEEEDNDEILTVVANSEHVVTLFPIKYLASDTVRVEHTEENKFKVHIGERVIYCHMVSSSVIRIDTILR